MVNDEQRLVINIFLNDLSETEGEAFIEMCKVIAEMKLKEAAIKKEKAQLEINKKLVEDLQAGVEKLNEDARRTRIIPFVRK